MIRFDTGHSTQSLGASPVNVCFLIDSLSRAGTETQMLALIRELDRTRVRPSLVLLDGTSESSRELEPKNCPILRLGLKRLCGTASVAASRKLLNFWHEHRIDVLQVYFLDSGYFGIPLARLAGIPSIVRVRNNLGYWLTPKHRLLNRIAGRLANITLTNTEQGREQLIHDEVLPPHRVRVIPNGVDVERFAVSPPRSNASGLVVGCVANLRPVKNIDGLLRTARMVLDRHPNVKFQVAGDGPQRAELERLRDELELENRFEFLGSVANIPTFLGNIDIAVLPSHSEGMSNAILEYMAAGCAIVATDVGANAALLDGCGVIVPTGGESRMADAIGSLIQFDKRRNELGKQARTRVERDYSRTAMRLRFEAFYHKLRQNQCPTGGRVSTQEFANHMAVNIS